MKVNGKREKKKRAWRVQLDTAIFLPFLHQRPAPRSGGERE
jgi:hypothetical protein